MQLSTILSKSKTASPSQYPKLAQKEITVYDGKGRMVRNNLVLTEGYSFTKSSDEKLQAFCERYNEVSNMPDLIAQIYDNAIYLFETDPYRVILILNRAK